MSILRLLKSLCVVAVATAAIPAHAQENVALKGEMFIAGKTPVDPPPNEPKNSHAYMTVTGQAALRLYRSMRGKEEKDACQDGRKIKRAGSLACSIASGGKDAVCDFSIDLVKGALESGRVC